jgi:hypothetical protein
MVDPAKVLHNLALLVARFGYSANVNASFRTQATDLNESSLKNVLQAHG